MAKESVEKRYEKPGRIKPCVLTRDDILALTAIIQRTFTKPEIDRYCRISTVLNHTRVFSNSAEPLLSLEELGDRMADLSFWIEGWDQKTRGHSGHIRRDHPAMQALGFEGTAGHVDQPGARWGSRDLPGRGPGATRAA